ncbi:ribokinase [Conexibacter arvalis]|uniref:Ribokinase n=1 Tax=Conexibacter arvalis TaxID=912552 RepID=A0A840IDS3_9ACTN|nr:ribokinase [Conexibacter arvalis]MBB4663117.1 ribokinase [Conexibacter arvalis]
MRATVVGSIHLDWTLRVPALPRPGDTVLAGSRTTSPGGKGANQAVTLRRLGAEVEMVGAVGSDEAGAELLANFDAVGVGRAHVRVVDGEPSGIAIVAVDATGDNGILVAPGASGGLAPADVAAAEPALRGADVVLLQLEVPLETVSAAVDAARAAGVPVVLNAAPARPLPDALLAALDVLVVNEREALALAGEGAADAESAAAALLARGAGAVVVTLGADGALVLDAAGRTAIPAHRVEVVDTTGAGDAFVAAIAAGVGAGRDVRDSALLASAAAALAVQRPGAQSAPTLAEAQAFLAARERTAG